MNNIHYLLWIQFQTQAGYQIVDHELLPQDRQQLLNRIYEQVWDRVVDQVMIPVRDQIVD